jgi:hypothetical protein
MTLPILLVHNCQATGLLADGRLTHRCDTLEGNSGSPILARINGRMTLIGIQSSAPVAARRRKEDNMALSSPVFYQQLQQFIQQGRHRNDNRGRSPCRTFRNRLFWLTGRAPAAAGRSVR